MLWIDQALIRGAGRRREDPPRGRDARLRRHDRGRRDRAFRDPPAIRDVPQPARAQRRAIPPPGSEDGRDRLKLRILIYGSRATAGATSKRRHREGNHTAELTCSSSGLTAARGTDVYSGVLEHVLADGVGPRVGPAAFRQEYVPRRLDAASWQTIVSRKPRWPAVT